MYCLRKDIYVVISMAQKMVETGITKTIMNDVAQSELSAMDTDKFKIKSEAGGYTIACLSRDGRYMEIHIDKKLSEETIRAFLRGVKQGERPYGATQVMRGLYDKFNGYKGIDYEEAKLITRAFLAISETGESEQWVVYQRTYFKKPATENEERRELPKMILGRDRKKELTAAQQILKNSVDRFMNDYRLAKADIEKSISLTLSQSYDNSGLLRIVLENLNSAKTELPGIYKPKELNGAIEQYGYALVIVQGLELQEPDRKSQTEHERSNPGKVVPVLTKSYTELKELDEKRATIVDRVRDYFELTGLERGGKLTKENVRKLDDFVIGRMLKDIEAVNQMSGEYNLPARLVKHELERVIKLLKDELEERGNRKE